MRPAPSALVALVALVAPAAGAQTIVQIDGAVGLGYTATTNQVVVLDPAEPQSSTTGRLYTEVRPGIAVHILSSRLTWDAAYVFAASIGTDGANTYSNGASLGLAAQLTNRSTLTLYASATQGGTAFQLSQRAPEAGTPQIRAPGNPNLIAASFAEAFTWEASQQLRLRQGLTGALNAPLDELGNNSIQTGAYLGLDRRFQRDAMGAELSSSVAHLQPLTALGVPFINIINTALLRWSHDLSLRWSGQASAGVQQTLELTGAKPLAIVPTGNLSAQILLGSATASLNFAHGATNNLQTGTVEMTDQFGLRAFVSLDPLRPRSFGASAGFLHSEPLGKASTLIAPGTGNAVQGDIGIVWDLSEGILATARYSIAYQFDQGAGLNASLTHVFLVGLTARWSTGRYTPPLPTLGQRVDELDSTGNDPRTP